MAGKKRPSPVPRTYRGPSKSRASQLTDPGLSLSPRAAIMPAAGQRDPRAQARRKSLQQKGEGGVTGMLGEWVGPNLAQLLTTGHTGSAAGAGIDALTMLPFLRGPRAVLRGAEAIRAGEGVKAATTAATESMHEAGPLTQAYRARRLRHNEAVAQLPHARARNPISKGIIAAIEGGADVTSKALQKSELVTKVPGLRTATSAERVTKALGRRQRISRDVANAENYSHVKALKKIKAGSREDIAHFWYVQLPKAYRNSEGLGLVRGMQAKELDDLISGRALEGIEKKERALRVQMAKAKEEAPDVFPADLIKQL